MKDVARGICSACLLMLASAPDVAAIFDLTANTSAGTGTVVQVNDDTVLIEVGYRYGRGDLAGAIRELKRAIVFRPEDPQLHFMLGNALYRKGELFGAALQYATALRLRPQDVEARVSRGFVLYELGDCMGGHAEWTAAVASNPEEPLARAALAVALLCAGQPEAAVAEYYAAIRMDPRYEMPSNLQIDIRWKHPVVAALEEVKRLADSFQDENLVREGGTK